MHPLTRRVGRAAAVLALLGAVVTMAVSLLAGAVPGPTALVGVLAPHLLLACAGLALVGLALARDRGATLAALAVLALLAVRHGSEFVSLPVAATPGDDQVSVLSWNLELGSGAASIVADVVIGHDADIVAIQELTPDAAAALEADGRIRDRYPYRILDPHPNVLGMGILSALPVLDVGATEDPPMMHASIESADGRTLHVIDVHPLPGQVALLPGTRLPTGFDPTQRDAALGLVREEIDAALATGDPVVVLGDFNVAPSEPGYARIATGLLDAHVEAGTGPGWTWRPSRFEGSDMALLRIDYVFASQDLRPSASTVDCRWSGDHCLVHAVIVVPAGAASR